jgi:hypothetical protein
VGPVDREAEPAPLGGEDLLVDLDQLVAEFEEVGSRDRNRMVLLGWVAAERWLESLLVRLARIATDAIEILDPTFGR